jgi:hypothetical protein
MPMRFWEIQKKEWERGRKGKGRVKPLAEWKLKISEIKETCPEYYMYNYFIK